MKKLILAAGLLALNANLAQADAIEGLWKRPNGNIIRIFACGGNFCVTPAGGPKQGQDAGKFAASGGGRYAGSLTDLANGKTYNGKGTINGDHLSMSGCVFGGLICKSEDWTRQ